MLSPQVALLQGKFRAVFAVLFAVLAAGCISLLPPFDQAGVSRITELSKKSLAVYQTLLDTKLEERGDVLVGKVAKSWVDMETETRVHLVFEQSREMNSGSIKAARELLAFWEDAQKKYCEAAKPDAAKAPAAAVDTQTSSASASASAANITPTSGSTLCAGTGRNEKEAMEDFVLKQDRTALERILGAMVKAEEAKKLAITSK